MTEKKEEWEDLDWPDLDRELTLRERLSQARVEQQVELLRPYAERYQVQKAGSYGFDEAGGLLRLIRGSGDDAETATWAVGQLASMIDRWVLAIERAQQQPLIKKGVAFTNGPKKGREHKSKNLDQAIKASYEEFRRDHQGRNLAEGLWKYLSEGFREVIEETADDVFNKKTGKFERFLYYRNDDGKEEKIKFKTFQNKLAAIKKHKI